MKMFKTRSWGFEIQEVEITRKTDKCVWFMTSRGESRELNTNYFDTWELAKDSIIKREQNNVNHRESQLKYAQIELEKAKIIQKC